MLGLARAVPKIALHYKVSGIGRKRLPHLRQVVCLQRWGRRFRLPTLLEIGFFSPSGSAAMAYHYLWLEAPHVFGPLDRQLAAERAGALAGGTDHPRNSDPQFQNRPAGHRGDRAG